MTCSSSIPYYWYTPRLDSNLTKDAFQTKFDQLREYVPPPTTHSVGGNQGLSRPPRCDFCVGTLTWCHGKAAVRHDRLLVGSGGNAVKGDGRFSSKIRPSDGSRAESWRRHGGVCQHVRWDQRWSRVVLGLVRVGAFHRFIGWVQVHKGRINEAYISQELMQVSVRHILLSTSICFLETFPIIVAI